MRSFEHKLPDTTGESELLALIDQLNADPDVHGILVQLPLPDQIDSHAVINAIDPDRMSTDFILLTSAGFQQGQRDSCPVPR